MNIQDKKQPTNDNREASSHGRSTRRQADLGQQGIGGNQKWTGENLRRAECCGGQAKIGNVDIWLLLRCETNQLLVLIKKIAGQGCFHRRSIIIVIILRIVAR